jgi:hypothetical protein
MREIDKGIYKVIKPYYWEIWRPTIKITDYKVDNNNFVKGISTILLKNLQWQIAFGN